MLACAGSVLAQEVPLPEPPAQVVPEAAPTPAPSLAQELLVDEPARNVRPRTESESGQFIVHGDEFATRGAIASLADTTRKALSDSLGKDDEWENTIVIQLQGNPGDPVPASSHQ